MKKIDETGSMLDTDPSLYTGFEVDPVTGKAVKKGEDDEMNDKDLHSPEGVPDDPKHPNINVQAEAYKPGFVISLVEEPLDEINPNHPVQDMKTRGRLAAVIGSNKYAARFKNKDNPVKAAVAAGRKFQDQGLGASIAGGHGVAQTFFKATDRSLGLADKLDKQGVGIGKADQAQADQAKADKFGKSWKVEDSALDTLKAFQQIVQEDETIKMVWEDTTTGQKGYVTPALFVKVYSKMLVAEQAKEARAQSGSEQKPMSESKPNMALANELLNIGLVNNVKKTAEVLREENPMRKAMEIFYASKNSNADKDEVKYVPSVIKEGKAVLPKESAPVVLSKPQAEPVVETKKKRVIYW